MLRYCPHCNTHHPGPCPNKERRRGSSTQRGYTSTWARRSSNLIARHPRCAHCGSTHDLTTDHITPKAQGGTDALTNLQVLCRQCNSSKKHHRGVGKHRERDAQRPLTNFRRISEHNESGGPIDENDVLVG